MNLLHRLRFLVLAASTITISASDGWAQEHVWGKFGTPRPRPVPPEVLLDKPPRVVQFQLDRLDNERLVMVHRRDDDPKFIPVFREILSRGDIAAEHLVDAVEAMVKLDGSNRVDVMLDAIAKMDAKDRDSVDSMTSMLAQTPTDELMQSQKSLMSAADGENATKVRAALVALASAGQTDDALRLAKGKARGWLLDGVPLIEGETNRLAMEPLVRNAILQDENELLRQRAAASIIALPIDGGIKFDLLAPLVFAPEKTRETAIESMLQVDPAQRGKSASIAVLNEIILMAERTDKADRTSDEFLSAMTLAEQLLPQLPAAEAAIARQRIEEVTVRLVRIATVEEEMRYDVEYFAVAAGRPVQIVLINHDVMPHNLVIGKPGTLKTIAAEGLAVGPRGVDGGLPYVPNSDDVLQATDMVNTNSRARITFDAPKEPGEYPYVCTFPQHWYRMYGVMVVVDDLDAFLANPTPPANPIGSNRSFVADWTIDKFDDLQSAMEQRSSVANSDIGAKIFNEASCAGCHQVAGVGGKVGPALDDIYTKYKGSHAEVLRSILHPSQHIDPKYVMQKVLTFDGLVINGVLESETEEVVRLLTGSEDQKPVEIALDDIDAMLPSKISLMPKALMNQYSQEEIYELLSYLEAQATSTTAAN